MARGSRWLRIVSVMALGSAVVAIGGWAIADQSPPGWLIAVQVVTVVFTALWVADAWRVRPPGR